MAETGPIFGSKIVLVLAHRAHDICVEILMVLHPHVIFKKADIFPKVHYVDCHLLFLDTYLSARQIRHYSRKAASVVVYGKVPKNLNAGFHSNSQIVKSDDVLGDLWSKFVKFWDDSRPKEGENFEHAWFSKLGWVSTGVFGSIMLGFGSYSNPTPSTLLKTYQPIDFIDYHYDEDMFCLYYFHEILSGHVGEANKANILTAILLLSRQDAISRGKVRMHQVYDDFAYITGISPKFGAKLINEMCEREIQIHDRVYRCFVVVSERTTWDVVLTHLFVQNPRIEVIVLIRARRFVIQILHLFRNKPMRYGNHANDLADGYKHVFDASKMLYEPGKSDVRIYVRRRKFLRYLRMFVSCEPFAEQDARDVPLMLEATRNFVLDDAKSGDAKLSDTNSSNEIFGKVLEHLGKTFTVRYNHLKVIEACVQKTLQEMNSSLEKYLVETKDG